MTPRPMARSPGHFQKGKGHQQLAPCCSGAMDSSSQNKMDKILLGFRSTFGSFSPPAAHSAPETCLSHRSWEPGPTQEPEGWERATSRAQGQTSRRPGPRQALSHGGNRPKPTAGLLGRTIQLLSDGERGQAASDTSAWPSPGEHFPGGEEGLGWQQEARKAGARQQLG